MDWDRIEGSWKQFRGKAKSHWRALTDDELRHIAGRQDALIGKLQERYGYSRDRARREVELWAATDVGNVERPARTGDALGLLHVVGNLNSAVHKSLKEHPRETLAVAAVVGFLLGALWRSRGRVVRNDI
jgi:uncharacterized protein YjbJ (UPF0337 family)